MIRSIGVALERISGLYLQMNLLLVQKNNFYRPHFATFRSLIDQFCAYCVTGVVVHRKTCRFFPYNPCITSSRRPARGERRREVLSGSSLSCFRRYFGIGKFTKLTSLYISRLLFLFLLKLVKLSFATEKHSSYTS